MSRRIASNPSAMRPARKAATAYVWFQAGEPAGQIDCAELDGVVGPGPNECVVIDRLSAAPVTSWTRKAREARSEVSHNGYRVRDHSRW
jgi:hypothetical protein